MAIRRVTGRALSNSRLANFVTRLDVWTQLTGQPSSTILFHETDGRLEYVEVRFPSDEAAQRFDRLLMTFGVFCHDHPAYGRQNDADGEAADDAVQRAPTFA